VAREQEAFFPAAFQLFQQAPQTGAGPQSLFYLNFPLEWQHALHDFRGLAGTQKGRGPERFELDAQFPHAERCRFHLLAPLGRERAAFFGVAGGSGLHRDPVPEQVKIDHVISTGI